MDPNEARKQLEACVSEEVMKEYKAHLRKWFLFSSPITKEMFDTQVRKLLTTDEQIKCHNNYLLSMLAKCRQSSKAKGLKVSSETGGFEYAEYYDYIHNAPTPPSDLKDRSAAAELFIPDSGFVACKISVIAWENGMQGATDKVTELIVHACQVFIKNIITAMVSRKKGYKIRDKKLQFGFNLPVPDPFIRNSNNLIDDSLESKVDINDEDTFQPKLKPSLDIAEQKVAFAYSCARKTHCDNSLTVKLLYETIRDNPKVLGLHSMSSTSLFKLSLLLNDDIDSD